MKIEPLKPGSMKKHLLFIAFLLIILFLSFYWFAWRPAQIKHACSWVKWTIAAVPAYPAMTEAELKAQGLIKVCLSPTPTRIPRTSVEKSVANFWNDLNIQPDTCEQNNKKIIDEYSKPREAIPAKEGWDKATDDEYKFCLRDKGL